MPYLLCIETATEVCSVAIFKDDKPVSVEEIDSGNAHASLLVVLIQQAIKKINLPMNKLDAIVVSKGPGSYTGLRVGVSTAKGICYALNKPLIAVNTLHALVNTYQMQHPQNKALVCPMIDARRMEVYTTIINPSGQVFLPTEAKIINSSSFEEVLNKEKVIFIGNGAEKCKTLITSKNAVFETAIRCSSVGLGSLGLDLFNRAETENLAYFEPYYLKDFVGTTPKKQS
jgi:tRNA threonylcarbamoyladenosine biosynthesis protein TsaB